MTTSGSSSTFPSSNVTHGNLHACVEEHTKEFVFSPKQRLECQNRLKPSAVIAAEGVKSQTAARIRAAAIKFSARQGRGPPKEKLNTVHGDMLTAGDIQTLLLSNELVYCRNCKAA